MTGGSAAEITRFGVATFAHTLAMGRVLRLEPRTFISLSHSAKLRQSLFGERHEPA